MLDLPEELTRTVSGLYERTATTLAMSDSSSEDLLSWTVAIITDGGAILEGGNEIMGDAVNYKGAFDAR